MGLSWTPHSKPKICFGMRPSEHVGHHLVGKDGQLKDVFQQLVYGAAPDRMAWIKVSRTARSTAKTSFAGT